MLSMISFSFIIFIMIIQLDHSSANSCFNFNGTKNNQVNHCEVKDQEYTSYNIPLIAKCIQCIIKYIDFEIELNCSRKFVCAILVFGNNMMFETFFSQSRNIIRDLFPTLLTTQKLPVLEIIVSSYNISKITNNYIDEIINMDAPNTTIFITFKKRSQGLAPLTVENGSYPIKFKLLVVKVQCDNSNSSATYLIFGAVIMHGRLFMGTKCAELQSTKQVSS
jgi:hypothetical protein